MTPDCSGQRFGIVAARFYADLAEEMVAGAMDGLRECNVAPEDISVYDVPGCFELPLACRNLINTDRFDALVALGAVIRGETAHFDFVAAECARGIMDVELSTGTPIGFGVLTTENRAQAERRAARNGGNKGCDAALAAAALLRIMADMPPMGSRRN